MLLKVGPNPGFSSAGFSHVSNTLQFPSWHRSVSGLNLPVFSSLWCKDMWEWSLRCQVNATPSNCLRKHATPSIALIYLTEEKAVYRKGFFTFMPPPCVSTIWTLQALLISQMVSLKANLTHHISSFLGKYVNLRELSKQRSFEVSNWKCSTEINTNYSNKHLSEAIQHLTENLILDRLQYR